MSSFNLSGKSPEGRLFWSSLLLLFGEILAIRWLGIEVPAIWVFPNLVLLVVLVGASAGVGDPGKFKAPRPLLLVALGLLLITGIFSVQLGIPTLSLKLGSASTIAVLTSIALLLALVGSLIAVFINLGAIMGEGFSALPPLRAYSINLFGSIVGVVLVALISLFQWPPPVWIFLTGLICWQIVKDKLVPILTAAFILAACTTTLHSKWSPYSKLDVVPLEVSGPLGQGNYVLNSNNHYFHFGLRMLDDKQTAELRKVPDSQQKATVQHYYDFLRISFCAPHHDRVLVLGGGSGNDVAYALAHGAQHVDVVEIDPIICKLGLTQHPDKPYADPRVTLHNEDARTFLRYSKDKFDLIEFAYLDPGTTLNTASFVRVDNFVYTEQSIKSALSHLNDDGLLTISFATGGKHPVTRRLYQTIERALGSAPRCYVDEKWDSVLFLAGPAAKETDIEGQEGMRFLRPWPVAGDDSQSKPSTDDWPFLYLEYDASGVILYFFVLFIAVVAPAWILTRSAAQGDINPGAWGNMFFLGQAFMLVETKSITQLSLFFGATWLVSSAVIGCVLVLAFFANWCASRLKTTNPLPFYFGLGAALLLDFFFRVPADTQMHPLLLAWTATLIGCLPILFGGLIFSLCFRNATAPARYLSANLLGVAVGGLTENLCLATGIKSLVIIAMVLYGLSLFALRVSAKAKPVV